MLGGAEPVVGNLDSYVQLAIDLHPFGDRIGDVLLDRLHVAHPLSLSTHTRPHATSSLDAWTTRSVL